VFVELSGRDMDPASIAEVISEECTNESPGAAAEDLHLGWCPASDTGNDVGPAIAIDITRGNVDGYLQRRGISKEAADQGSGGPVPDFDKRACRSNDVGFAIAGDIAGRDLHAALVMNVVSEEGADGG